MDALLILLALGGFIVSLVKKANAKQKQSANAQIPAPQPAPQEKIPYTKEEWAQYLAAHNMERKSKPAAQSVEAKPAPVAKPAAPSAPNVRSAPAFEGISTEGEEETEHAEHVRKIVAAETEARQRCETARELRRVNRERLRSAIVLREILDPPVTLRND